MKWRLNPEQEAEITQSVMASAGLTSSYLILLVLSTVIASFGLLSNSTATVIGAMIVAPLMGPILGTGLAYAQGDLVKLRQALSAEVLGVAMCLVVSTFIGAFLGPENIDFTQSEILGRTRPTLLDLAVGLAAGLAGAYSRVNRQVSDSIAGVAIAVALVPPLCTSGLCAAGALAGQPLWSESLGAFLLFFANFLTIQFASIMVFGVSGLGHWRHFLGEQRFRLAMFLNILLLAGTSYFLWNQFDQLIFERRLERFTRRVLNDELRRIPGANLDSLKVRVVAGKAEIKALTRSTQEIHPGFAALAEEQLARTLGLPVQLEVGTVLSGYVNASGTLYKQEDELPKRVEASLRRAVAGLGGCDFESFRITQRKAPKLEVFLSVRSPQVIDESLVARLTQTTEALLAQQEPEHWKLHLTVRSTLSQVFNIDGPVRGEYEWPIKPAEERVARIESAARLGMLRFYSQNRGGWTRNVAVSLHESQTIVRCDCFLTAAPDHTRLEQLQQYLREETGEPDLGLELRWSLGEEVGPFSRAGKTAQAQLIHIISATRKGGYNGSIPERSPP